jgi:hypothetical protein
MSSVTPGKCRNITTIFFSGVGLSPLGTAATSGLLYKLQMINEGDCGAIGGMKIGKGNRSTRRKPTPAPLCPPQIPHNYYKLGHVRFLPQPSNTIFTNHPIIRCI